MSINFQTGYSRRLPVYLLLDTSSSMAGVKIVGVQNGVTTIYQEIMSDPRAASTVHISIITFADQAYQMPLVPITQFTPPNLQANGMTALGGALHLLNESLDTDLIPNQGGEVKGDFKPLVFLLTDGQPNDHWQTEAQTLMARSTTANIIGIGIGTDADMNVIRQLTRTALLMQDVTPQSIRSLFQWVSNSIKTASQAANSPGAAGGQQVNLQAPPPGLVIQL
ncbi:MAG TPA: VWA domain-containing protein [Ktedonobacterales bacterium]|nr:VWA domain-containing protein [Ktedonobacterales bacterium]